MSFPIQRPRRLRASEALRGMVRETHLTNLGLVMPYFVVHGEGVHRPIESMPGNFHLSPDMVVQEARRAHAAGVPAVLLFGLPRQKDPKGSEAWDDQGTVQLAVRALKRELPDLVVITDVCMCEYTSHGHCGEVAPDGRGALKVLNDPTLDLLAKVALSHARAGADIVAPSDMMDGRIGHLRAALDSAGFGEIALMSYAAKYASAFYGPFRAAAESAPAAGDRRGYQMDPSNLREALREVSLDIAEGADIIMVKPALAYLDVIRAVRERVDVPVAAYSVSGEFSMIKAAAERGFIDEKRIVMEMATSITRAGAGILISYHAVQIAEWIRG